MDLVPSHSVQSKCGRSFIHIKNDMPLGELHDFLLEIKGYVVDRMIASHKQEVEASNAHKQEQSAPQEVNSCCNREA